MHIGSTRLPLLHIKILYFLCACKDFVSAVLWSVFESPLMCMVFGKSQKLRHHVTCDRDVNAHRCRTVQLCPADTHVIYSQTVRTMTVHFLEVLLASFVGICWIM